MSQHLKLLKSKRFKTRFMVYEKGYCGWSPISPSTLLLSSFWFKETFLRYRTNKKYGTRRNNSAKMYFVYTSLKKESFN